MLINLKNSCIKADKITAITKAVIPASYSTPECYTMCVYLEEVAEPIIHTYKDEYERDTEYTTIIDACTHLIE